MVDLHSHLIWNVDDGSKSREMTLNMLRQAIQGGTTKLVLTPHYVPGEFMVPFNEIKERVKEVKTLAKEENLNIEIYSGQEVFYTNNILENYQEGYIGTINNSKYMLIEFSMKNFSQREIIENMYELQLKGIVPIIAHPERYLKFIKSPSLINELIREGFLFQLNLGSLTGEFGKDVKKTAKIFFQHKIYSFIGSDAHRDEKRNPNMGERLKVIDKENNYYLRYIIESSESLLNNEEVKFIGEKIEKKRGLFSLFS